MSEVPNSRPGGESIGSVSRDIDMRIVSKEQNVPLSANISYRKEDPYAVNMAFNVGLDKPVEWIFARDLLAGGAKGHEGIGDVVVWPSVGAWNDKPTKLVNIELTSPFGTGHFQTPAKGITDFLTDAFNLVPSDKESGYVDLEIESFLMDILNNNNE